MKVENFKNPLILLLYGGTCCENVGIFFFFRKFGESRSFFPQNSLVCVEIILFRLEKYEKISSRKNTKSK